LGLNQLPSRKEMLEDTVENMNKLWKAGYKKRQAHMLGENQVNVYF